MTTELVAARNAARRGRGRAGRSNNQNPLPLRDLDADAGAGVELEEVFFDSIAEDHPTLGHVGFDHEWCRPVDLAEDKLGSRRSAGKRFPDCEHQLLGIPREIRAPRLGPPVRLDRRRNPTGAGE